MTTHFFNDFSWLNGDTPAGNAPAVAATGNAPAGAPAPGADASGMPMIIMMVVILAIFFFFMRRSQKRQQTEQEKMITELKSGQRVMLHSGLFGKIDKIDKENKEVRLLVDEAKNVTLTYSLLAINKVVTEEVQSVKKE